ncbi:polysaccharide lyase [Cereibacter sphaeroides]|nr:polysaccharide lyase [Cereibacter sphaeroides]
MPERALKAVAVASLLAATSLPSPGIAQRLDGARSLSETDWGYTIVDTPVAAGFEAQRFEVRPGDCAAGSTWDDCATDRERSEFRPRARWEPGADLWIGFALLLPEDFASSEAVNTTLLQIHQQGGPIRTADGGQVSRPPVMQIEARGERLRLTVHIAGADNIHHDLGPLSALRGDWRRMVVHFDSAQPRLQIWINDEAVADITDWPLPDPEFFYLKYGLYRSFVSRHDGPMPTQVAFFDEMRLGTSAAEVRPDPARPVD